MPGLQSSPSRSLIASLLLTTVCILIFAGRSPAEQAPPGSCTQEFPFTCGGVLDDEVGKAARADGEWRPVPCDPLPLLLHSSISAQDSIYIVALVRDIYPSMELVLGPPVSIETLAVKIDTTTRYTAYAVGNMIGMPQIPAVLHYDNDRDGAVDEDPFDGIDNDGDGRIDEDLATSPWWDNLFIHEMTHAMQCGLLRTRITPAWLIEGFAMTAEYFVPREAMAAGIQRKRAQNWILITPSEEAPVPYWNSVPVVFVGPDNLPVDPPGLSVNGRIIERVPGGVVVARDCEKTLTFRSDGECIGTVTLPDSLARMAILLR